MAKTSRNDYIYIICRKNYLLDDEVNVFDGDTPNEILKKLKEENIKISRRTLFNLIKNQTPLKGEYLIYKINIKE